jgi:uncharacterized membrane protein
MKTTKTLPTLLCLVVMISLTGCAMFNHGTMHYNRTTTIGMELIDLKKARDNGALSEEEYTKLKEEIMKGGPIKAEFGVKN